MRLYAGTQEFVEFFERTLEALEITDGIDYEVEDVDGELEIVIYYGEEI